MWTFRFTLFGARFANWHSLKIYFWVSCKNPCISHIYYLIFSINNKKVILLYRCICKWVAIVPDCYCHLSFTANVDSMNWKNRYLYNGMWWVTSANRHTNAHTDKHIHTLICKHMQLNIKQQSVYTVQHTYTIGEWTYTRRYFAKLLIIHENLIKRKKNEAQHSRMMYQIADTCMSCRAMHTFVLRIAITNVDISWNRLETISSFVWYFTVLASGYWM